MSTSPTKRTLDELRKQGFTVQVVERFCPFSKRRIDLFGCIDIVCASNASTILGVQATTGENASKRIAKSMAEPRLRIWLAAGGKFEVWGWRKLKRGKRKGGEWEPVITSLVLSGGEIMAKEEL